MKKFRLLFLLMFVAVLGANAQGGGGGGFQRRTPEERAKMQVDRLSDSLNLTVDKQKQDLTNVFLDYYKAQDQLRAGLQPGERPKMEDMQKIMTDRDAKLQVILTKDQFQHFKDMEAAMRNRQQRPPGQ